ncbi:MAG TPA: GWxTD domain-containing protein [Clostridiales bacterium]|nr:GWxTD domain-containing protein [Clostridiales bacterium]
MIRTIVLIALFVLPLNSVLECQSRPDVFDEAGVKGLPVFRYNIFRSLTKTENDFILNIHAEIPNERLQFRKKDSVYEASYTVASAVFRDNDTDGIPLFQKTEIRNVSVAEYKQTQSPRSEYHHNFKFSAEPGEFTVVLTMRDENTKKKHVVKKQLEFPESSDIVVSDIRMVFWTDDNDFENSYSDLINNVVEKENDYTGALFEMFTSSKKITGFELRYRILNSSGTAVYDDKFDGKIKNRLQLQVLKIPLENLLAGNYRIEMDLVIGGKKYIRDTVFYLRWGDLSLNVSDIDSALEQMLYIADYDSIKDVFKMPEEEKKEWFKNFWNGLETSLNLKSNSLMEEYFRRVTYANLHFSVPQKEGWKTDMGKVLCMMGDPDEIQSYPFAKNQKPYEVWIYYDLNVQYIFDYVGGEHRLRK